METWHCACERLPTSAQLSFLHRLSYAEEVRASKSLRTTLPHPKCTKFTGGLADEMRPSGRINGVSESEAINLDQTSTAKS